MMDRWRNRLWQLVVLLICFLSTRPVFGRGVPFPGILPNQSPVENKGLYTDAEFVISMNGESLGSRVYNKDHATYLELYNSYCGFCKRFAPHWKAMSEELKNWRDIVHFGAIDCSRDENNDICREFNVLEYPTVRYIPPKYPSGENQLGIKLEHPNHEIIKAALIDFLLQEPNKQPFWPDLNVFTGDRPENLFDNASTEANLAILIVDASETDHNTTGIEIILDLHSVKEVIVRRTETIPSFIPVNMNPKPWVYAVSRAGGVLDDVLDPLPDPLVKPKIISRILNYLKLHNIECNMSSLGQASSSAWYPVALLPAEVSINAEMGRVQQIKIKEKVKELEGTVFRADLEMALKYALFHEIPHFPEIADERLQALKQFIASVARYFPFGQNGVRFLKEIQDFVMAEEKNISGSDFAAKVKAIEGKHSPVFSSSRWVGCYSDKENLRRFPCGLWTMFHHLTVAAENAETSTDPLEVLQAMHGYVKYFFGCSDCSQHFQAMAKRNKMWSVSSKDNAILWLWVAHNEVNKRLHGDITEDPEFPKAQFPSKEICPKCYKDSTSNFSNSEIDWDKTEVLFFMKRIHALQSVSILGVDNETALPGVAERLTSTRYIRRVFNDMDFKMGVLLYVFCIGMLVVAAKLFVKRHGYRKKMYVHDILGKV